MAYQDILCEQDGAVLTVTLNRPDKLNAYTATMGREIEDAFRKADADDSVRAIVVTGAGRGFCAGADISGGADSFDAKAGKSVSFGDVSKGERRAGGGFVEAIHTCRKPSIVAINGAAVGVGATLTLPMDIRLAAEGAKIGFVFARRGLVPEAGSAWFLPRLVGLSQALNWCLTGRLFDAQEAQRGGLVSEVLAPEDLLPRALEIAREIATETSPVSVALTRQMLWQLSGEDTPWNTLSIDGALAMELGSGGDVKEGVAAFLEKRKPAFPSRVSQDIPKMWDDFLSRQGQKA